MIPVTQLTQPCLFLDPGVLLNFCLLEEGADILAALPYRILVTPAMSTTSYTTERAGETREHTVASLIHQGVLAVVDRQTPEVQERALELACLGLRGSLGELAAQASVCEGMVATDDLATVDLMTAILPEVPLCTTVALLYDYVGLAQLARPQTVSLIMRLHEDAVFVPNNRDTFFEWWHNHLAV